MTTPPRPAAPAVVWARLYDKVGGKLIPGAMKPGILTTRGELVYLDEARGVVCRKLEPRARVVPLLTGDGETVYALGKARRHYRRWLRERGGTKAARVALQELKS